MFSPKPWVLQDPMLVLQHPRSALMGLAKKGKAWDSHVKHRRPAVESDKLNAHEHSTPTSRP